MALQIVKSDKWHFIKSNGKPLANGYIYVGLVDQDPRDFPKTVVFVDETNTQIPAFQPLRTGANGEIINPSDGMPIKTLVDGNYSLLIQNNVQAQVDYIPNFEADGSGGSGSLPPVFGNASVGQTEIETIYEFSAANVHINGVFIPPTDYTIQDSTITIGAQKIVLNSGMLENDEYFITLDSPTSSFPIADNAGQFGRYIEYYGGVGDGVTDNRAAFNAAAVDLISGAIGRIYLSPNQNYIIETTDSSDRVFVNFIEGNNSTITQKGAGTFTYKDNAQVALYLSNLKLVKIGFKNNPDTTTNLGFYDGFDRFYEMTEAVLNKVQFTALTSEGDPNSWNDDVNEARARECIRYTAEWSRVTDLTFRGTAVGVFVYAHSSNTSRYEIDNVMGYNVETLVGMPFTDGVVGDPNNKTFFTGQVSNLKILNNTAQKDYWNGQNVGIGNNGKDCLLIESDHAGRSMGDNISGQNIIERTVYSQSGNYSFNNCDSHNAEGGAAQSKYEDNVDQTVYQPLNRLSNIIATSGNDESPDFSVYGQQDFIMTNFFASRITGQTSRRALTLPRRNKDCRIVDGRIEYAGVGIYMLDLNDLTGVEDASHVNMIFQDIEFMNIYSRTNNTASLFSFAGTFTGLYRSFKNTTFKRIKHEFRDEFSTPFDYQDINPYAYQFWAMDVINMEECEGIFRTTPWITTDSTDINVIDCNFELYSHQGTVTTYNNLKNTAGWTANRFDFTIEERVNLSQIPDDDVDRKAKFRFQRLNDSGTPVQCFPYWLTINEDIKTTSNVAISEQFNIDEYSFNMTVKTDDGTSIIRIFYNANTNTVTEIYNLGTLFSTNIADFTTNYVVYYDGGTNSINLRTDSVGFTSQNFKIFIDRDITAIS